MLGTTFGDVPDIVVPNKFLDVSVDAIATEANNKMLGQCDILLVPVGETRRAEEPSKANDITCPISRRSCSVNSIGSRW